MNIPNTYWRLGIESDNALRDMLNSSTAISPDGDFLLKVSRGHGIYLASYDRSSGCGHVRAVGIVTGLDAANRRLRVNWRETEIVLKPSQQGRRFWCDRSYFAFAKSVTSRYMLADIFAEHFPDLASIGNSAIQPNELTGDRSLPTGTSEHGGFVYLIKSPYGYKIGKTKNMKQRSQLFSVKLPFAIEILSFGWFENYSSAEAQFHREFAKKRLEGEWFDLNEFDISFIRNRMKT